MNFVFSVILATVGISLGEYSPSELRCLVCKSTIKEMSDAIDKVNPNKKIQIGGYRVDENGKLQEKYVPYARSGMHLSDLMDTICKSMEDYVRAKRKTTGELVLLKLMTSEGVMNPEMSEVDVIQDGDLNKSLEFYCEGIMEEFEEDIFDGLKVPSEDPVTSICSEATRLCDTDRKDEL